MTSKELVVKSCHMRSGLDGGANPFAGVGLPRPRGGADRPGFAAIDDLTIAVDPSATAADIGRLSRSPTPEEIDLAPWIAAEAIEGLKFAECLPVALAQEVGARRLADAESVREAFAEPVVGFELQSTTPSAALPIEPVSATEGCLQDRRSLEASSTAPRAGLRWLRPGRFRTPLQLASYCPETPAPSRLRAGGEVLSGNSSVR